MGERHEDIFVHLPELGKYVEVFEDGEEKPHRLLVINVNHKDRIVYLAVPFDLASHHWGENIKVRFETEEGIFTYEAHVYLPDTSQTILALKLTKQLEAIVRSSVRIPIETEVYIYKISKSLGLVPHSTKIITKGKTTDLSEHGAGIKVDKDAIKDNILQKGDIVYLKFPLPGNSKRSIYVKAEIRSVTPLEDGSYKLGVRFLSQSKAVKDGLRYIIKYYTTGEIPTISRWWRPTKYDHLIPAAIVMFVILLITYLIWVYQFYMPQPEKIYPFWPSNPKNPINFIFWGDQDTARYTYSATATALAALVGVMISMSMVAVQMMASKYTPKVTTYYFKDPWNMVVYSVSAFTIIHSFLLLGRTNNNIPLPLPQMNWNLWLMFGNIILLFAYVYHIIKILNIQVIADKINSEIHLYLELGEYDKAVQGVEELSDIVKKSTLDSDITTAEMITKKYFRSYLSYNDNSKEYAHFVKQTLYFMETIFRVADVTGEVRIAETVLDIYINAFKTFIINKNNSLLILAISSIRHIVDFYTENPENPMTPRVIATKLNAFSRDFMTGNYNIDVKNKITILILSFYFRMIKNLYPKGEVVHKTTIDNFIIKDGLSYIVGKLTKQATDFVPTLEAILSFVLDLSVELIKSSRIDIAATMLDALRDMSLKIQKNLPDSPFIYKAAKAMFIIGGVAVYTENPNAISLTVHRASTIVPTHLEKAYKELIENYKGIRKYFDYKIPVPYIMAFYKLVKAYTRFVFMHLTDEDKFIKEVSEKMAVKILKDNLEKLRAVFRGDDPAKYIPELRKNED
ncbi:DUF2254 domain-containing protein [bacterium 3DAC]|nr:DUF2254 domain-containing protein [bacterium 3DAC]